jgi:hypothetical protein
MRLLPVLCALWVGSPAGAAAQAPALPTLRDLPAFDVPRAQLAPEVRLALEAVEDALAVRPPRYAPSMHAAQWDHFFKNPLTRFLRRRMEAVQRAERALAALGADPAHRVVGAALTAVMLENTALAIRGLPVPREIARDADVAAVYRDALEEHTTPVFERAAHAYVACQTWAAPGSSWATFCAVRAGSLAPPVP